jgi:C1A family cysteine protease
MTCRRIKKFIVKKKDFDDFSFTVGALEYLIKRNHGTPNGKEIDVSRFFIMWVGTMLENEQTGEQQDEGTWIAEAIYGIVKYGFCEESLWPHTAYHRSNQPPKKVFEEAKKFTIVPLLIPPNLDSMKRCLNADLPFLIGIDCKLFARPDMIRINRGYNDKHTGIQTGTEGNHAVLVIGYDDSTQLFLVRNSWGRDWVSF